jgi:hypothetical protein
LRRHLTHGIGAVAEVGEELVELGLDRTLAAREQEGQECLEGERARSGEKLRLEACAFQKLFREQIVGEPAENLGI